MKESAWGSDDKLQPPPDYGFHRAAEPEETDHFTDEETETQGELRASSWQQDRAGKQSLHLFRACVYHLFHRLEQP